MPDATKNRASFHSAARTRGSAYQQQAARNQLHDHIDDAKLQAFLYRTIDSEEHASVIDHLNNCEPCREAIAVVLLARDDPKAAAELELDRRRRLQGVSESWQRRALRWTAIVFALMVILAIGVFWPAAKNSDSAFARWFVQSSEESLSETSISKVFPSTFVESSQAEEREERQERPRREPPPRRESSRQQRQPGWDTGPAPYVGNVRSSDPYIELPPQRSSTPAPEKPVERSSRPEPSGASSTPAPHTEAVPQSRMSSGPEVPQQSSGARPLSPRRLVVAADGQLRRTLDGGATWQTISVAPNVRLRALALSGTTVWAAGDGGSLFRSPDAAEHWQQVTLKYREVPLSADIARIHFADPQHGGLITADGQTWITVDGGQKWVFSQTGGR